MNPTLAGKTKLVDWIARLAAAAIMGQTLFFKFSAAPETVALFEKLGIEPWGRLATGGFELLAVALLLVTRTAGLGGLLTLGLMGGAVMSHLTALGIEVEGDGGALFVLAAVTLVAGAITTWLHRAELPIVGPRLET